MGLKTRKQIKTRQKNKRYKRRLKLKRKGSSVQEYFSNGFFVGLKDK